MPEPLHLPHMEDMGFCSRTPREEGYIRVETDAVSHAHSEKAIFLSFEGVQDHWAYLTIAEAKELIHALCAVVAATIQKEA